jgi:hypothetical protein
MAMVGHETESIYRRYAIVDESMHREAASQLDSWHAEQKAKAAAERRGSYDASRSTARDRDLRSRRGKTRSQTLTADYDERAHDDKEGNWRVAKSASTRHDGQGSESSDSQRQQ